MVVLKHRLQCQFCSKSFAREDRYLAHECKLMKRDHEFKTPVGQAAWGFYQRWLKSQRKTVPSPDTFLSSKFYMSFIKFARFSQQVQLPDVDAFIQLMKDKDFSPVMWTTHEVYTRYIEHLDRTSTPLKQAKTSVDTICRYAEDHRIDTSQFFDTLNAGELIDLLSKRKLSPWLLMFSVKFKEMYISRSTSEQKIKIDTFFRNGYWKKKLEKHSQDKELLKKYVQELGL